MTTLTTEGVTYFSRQFRMLSYREGGHPFNFHLCWKREHYGFYIYLYGLRLYWFR